MRMIEFVIMGNPVLVEAEDHWPLWVARLHALQISQNVGRPPSDFQIRDNDGNLLEPTVLVEDVPPGIVWLSPAVGAGGSHVNHRRKNFPPIMNKLGPMGGMVGRCGARNNYGAHADTQARRKRYRSRTERRNAQSVIRALCLDVHMDPVFRPAKFKRW
jgi:hypothetical protein